MKWPMTEPNAQHNRAALGPLGIGVGIVIAAALLVACGQSPTTGPGEIHWDRQTCEHCQMVISERRHAAQLRAPGERNVHAFDDVGCALLWLDQQGLTDAEPPLEVWVRDTHDANWIDGRSARFDSGHPTPMQYGWATGARGLDLPGVHQRVREAEQKRRREVSGRPDDAE